MTDEYSEDSRPEGATESPADGDTIIAEDPATPVAGEPSPQYGVGPFSIREVSIGGAWLIAFIASFFPVTYSGLTVWGSGIDWLLMIGVPTVAVFLLALRRLSPQGIRRVGSLGIDQFASVAFSVATVLWLAVIWNSFITLFGQSVFAATWVVWVEAVMMLAGVFLTVLAPFIAPFNQDFIGRTEVPAHRVARPARPVEPRPVAPAPAPAPEADAAPSVYADYAAPVVPVAAGDAATAPGDADAAPYWDADGDVVGADAASPAADVDATAGPDAATTVLPVAVEEPAAEAERAAADAEPVAAEPEPEPAAAEPEPEPEPEPVVAAQHQAFWALVPEERDIVDEIGIPVFRIGPTAWALVIEDRGEVFVVRHEDGRIGYLHDVSGVTRG